MMHVSKQISFKGNSFCFGNKNVKKKRRNVLFMDVKIVFWG